MKDMDGLKQNEQRNDRITNYIITVYLGSIITIAIILLNEIAARSLQDILMIKKLSLFLILVLLSIQSLNFYFRFIVKIQDSDFGKRLSVALSVVMLLLTAIAIFFPTFLLIGIGVFLFGGRHGNYNVTLK